jgi:membrane associated rhomboid family serine protease
MPVSHLLVWVTVAVFILQWLSSGPKSPFHLTEWLALDSQAVFRGQIWRLVTYGFCHSVNDLFHLAFNMLVLWQFGPVVEELYRRREFLWMYLTSIVLSGLIGILIDTAAGMNVSIIGASGATLALMSLVAFHFPRRSVMLFGLLRVEMYVLVSFYAVLTILFLLPMGRNGGIAHSCHLGGLLYGYLFGRLDLRLGRFLELPYMSRRFWRLKAAPYRVYPGDDNEPEPQVRSSHQTDVPSEELDQKVDAVLAKLFESGEAGLTEDERRLLMRASERYKQRR